MLRYAMLCYPIRYATLRYASDASYASSATPPYASYASKTMLRGAMLRYATLCCAMLRYSMLRYAMLATLRYASYASYASYAIYTTYASYVMPQMLAMLAMVLYATPIPIAQRHPRQSQRHSATHATPMKCLRHQSEWHSHANMHEHARTHASAPAKSGQTRSAPQTPT